MPRPSTTLFLAIAFFAWIVSPAPASADEEERRVWTQVQIIAHRGASAYAPENTLAAFRLAGRLGADTIELDVRQTKDKKLVVVHDRTLVRTTDVKKRFPKLKPWRVSDLTLKQIKKLDAGSWFGPRYKGERVPTLAEALRVIKDTGAGALVELKNPDLYPGIAKRVVAQIKADPYWSTSERLTVQSTAWRYVKTVNEALPHVRGAVLGRPSEEQLFGLRWYAEIVHPTRKQITPEYIRSVHRKWLDVYVYVVDDPNTMLHMIYSGVDGITTNRPDLLWRLRQL
jgi:glycerophosphoryl diester phosphodiesterase